MVECIIDDREHHISNLVDSFTVHVRIERIQVGDFAIVHDNKIYAIIERKTLKDYAASIRDNRINNREKMIEVREQTGCKLYYLIEGVPPKTPNTKIGRIPYKTIESSILHLTVRDNIFIIWTRDIQHSIRVLSNMTDTVFKYDIKPRQGGSEIELLKKKKERSDYEYAMDMWQTIDGIGPVTAGYLVERIPLEDFIFGNYDPSTLRPAVAELLDQEIMVADIIAAAPGIGAKSAEHIIETIDSMDQLTDPDTELYIAKNRKLGADRRARLIAVLKFIVQK